MTTWGIGLLRFTLAVLLAAAGIARLLASPGSIVVRAPWGYSYLMPVVPVLRMEIDLPPLMLWLVAPLLAFGRARWCRPIGDVSSHDPRAEWYFVVRATPL
jgi:hypothetical protein